MKWLDKNGNELQVGDLVRFGDRVGEVLIREDWTSFGPLLDGTSAGCYVSAIGYWGDARAVRASLLVRMYPCGCAQGEGDPAVCQECYPLAERERETAATQNMVADMERDGLL